MAEYLDTFCPVCDADVHVELLTRSGTLSVRGEVVAYEEVVALCPICDSPIGDMRIEGDNLARAYKVYRENKGILSPEEIRELRARYGLSLREFGRFLGFGEQTIPRYEHGDVPDQAHSTTLAMAKHADGAKMLLSQNGARLTSKSRQKIQHCIETMVEVEFGASQPDHAVIDEGRAMPSAANGYRRLSVDRVAALAFELAKRCRDLYWTKFQKAMFFADMVSYERCSRSLTGLSYAHAPLGPVMDRKEELRAAIANSGAVSFNERGWGEVLVPLQYQDQPFDAEELKLIDEVAAFVNTFDTAKELSEFSHQLSCWADSADGEVIEYTRDDGEVGKALRMRMER